MRLRYRHRRADLADSDVPISPLLDQTIVLYINVWSIALFLLWMAYHPLPPEGRLPINLSLVDSDPIPLGTRHIVRVTANRGGAIENIAVRDEAAAGWTDIGTDPRVLVGELKRRYAGRSPSVFGWPRPKLTLEIGDKLLYAYVIQVLDTAVQAGFTDVALVPIESADR